ncbi:MAG: MCE family protein [Phycisphaerales bacterium]|nr:MAG: MCE family protein [Phycisphaerales bacterium]
MTGQHSDIPQAVLRAERRLSWAWLVPLFALVFAGWLGYHAWLSRGMTISVQLDEGHGLRPGDDIRYRGIAVGQVKSVDLAEDSAGILITAALYPMASHLARAGTRLWVVRPHFGATGVGGLETLIGPRYLTILPGAGPPQSHFVGLAEPPIVESIRPGDLEIVLEAPRRSAVRAGSPVLYRGVTVGTVLSVGLTSDGNAIEARVHIRKAYAQLVRPETRFWSVAGVEMQLGVGGLSVKVESLEGLVAGGVAMATPPGAGEVVRTGHRFRLDAKPEDEWLEWEPLVVIGSSALPSGSPMPTPLRAVMAWKEGRWIKSERFRRGWVLQTEDGLLGPEDVLTVKEAADEGSVVLEVAGRTIPLTSNPKWAAYGLALLDAQVANSTWPSALRRFAGQPEDCLAVADPAAAPLPLAVARLTPNAHSWQIDPAISVDETWHGACVLARSDGRLVGMVIVGEDAAHVALLPPIGD